MYNVNGPPRGANVTQDQSSYDLLFKDVIINNASATNNGGYFSYNLGTDSINGVYKAEVIAATIKFNGSIPTNVQNSTLLVNIPQLNGNTVRVAGNVSTGNSSVGSNSTQGSIFCQIPDNSTPITPGGLTSNGIISLLIGSRIFETVQNYNPPISKINTIDMSFWDSYANPVLVGSTSETISTFYFTIRLYYLQKRMSTTSFSTSVLTNVGTGTMDSLFQSNNR